MIFTVAPVILLGATDQSVGKQYCLRFPRIYSLGIQKSRYSKKLFGLYFLEGIWQSLVVYFTFDYAFRLSNFEGDSGGPFSTSVAVSVVIIASLLVGFNTYYWSWFIWVFVFAEILIVFGFVMSYGIFQSLGSQLFGGVFGDVRFWFGMPFAVLLAGLPRYTIQFTKQWWYPDELDVVRQIRKKEKIEKAKAIKEKKRKKPDLPIPVINVEDFIENVRSSMTENNNNKV